MTTAEHRVCQGCHNADAVACDECRRALALKSFEGISRHPESGTGCLVCEDGPPDWCGTCLVEQVASSRTALRNAGHDIGRWPDYPGMRQMERQSEALMQTAAELARTQADLVTLRGPVCLVESCSEPAPGQAGLCERHAGEYDRTGEWPT